MNVVAVIGNLTKDPELRSTGGLSICKLRIAVNDRRKNSAGEWEDAPGYFDVTAFGGQGENAAKFLSKGRPVGIAGRLSYREWETDEGQRRSAVEIVASEIKFLGGRDEASKPTADEAEF